jgi:hypothetical protein
MSSTALSICVFCASASGLPDVYLDAARRMGTEIARRGHRLVYGGGNVGLMAEVARSVQASGGEVFGAIPRALVERELAYGPADELVVTETLRERNDTFCQYQQDGTHRRQRGQAELCSCRRVSVEESVLPLRWASFCRPRRRRACPRRGIERRGGRLTRPSEAARSLSRVSMAP